MTDPKQNSAHERFYALIRMIPRGRVATYGQVAALAGMKGRARMVGRALKESSPSDALPWQRVVNAAGRVSYHPDRLGADRLQRELLLEEGIAISPSGRIDMEAHRWNPGPEVMTARPIEPMSRRRRQGILER